MSNYFKTFEFGLRLKYQMTGLDQGVPHKKPQYLKNQNDQNITVFELEKNTQLGFRNQ